MLICENMLMAQGFVEAKSLASKFYGLYSLLKELLSKQLHYDWGLRAVKSVLVIAGAMKRADPDLPEGSVLLRALRDSNIPKIVKEDEVVFFGLLGDLFPGLNPPRAGRDSRSKCGKGVWRDGPRPGRRLLFEVRADEGAAGHQTLCVLDGSRGRRQK